MATVAELQAFRSKLQEARLTGLREVHDSDGSSVSYKSDAEMARALASIDSEIKRLETGARPVSIAYPQTSKGL